MAHGYSLYIAQVAHEHEEAPRRHCSSTSRSLFELYGGKVFSFVFVCRSNKGWKSSSILLIAIVIVYLVTNTPRLLLNLAEYLRQVCVGILAFIRRKYFHFLPSKYSISIQTIFMDGG